MSLLRLVPWWGWAALGAILSVTAAYYTGKHIGHTEGRVEARLEAIERTNEAIEGVEDEAERFARAYRACAAAGGVWDFGDGRCRAQ